MAQAIQIATERPVTKFINNNVKDDYINGDIISFKYGGIYYTRFLIKESEDEDLISEVYKILIGGIRKTILKSWIFEYERLTGLSFSINRPFYNAEDGYVRVAE